MQVPILKGTFVDVDPEFRDSYPHNLVPVPKGQGISNGYLRPADGLKLFAPAVGADRGGIEWDGICYRVQGTNLITVNSDGTTTIIGDVGSGGAVTFDYSFDYLGVASGGRLYLYDKSTLTQITDPDLGTVLSFVWIDGYFLTTDGENLIVTELNDPFSVNPLKYIASEVDPDPVVAVLELSNEVYAVNVNSIEAFTNVGGVNFPFNRIDGAQIQKGAAGSKAAVVFDNQIAFVGGGRNEPPSVYVALNGQYQKISTQEIEKILKGYTEQEIADVVVETRTDNAHKWLYIHLPDQTIVYDKSASQVLQVSVWFTLSGGIANKTMYPARNFVWCYNQWLAGDPSTGKISTIVKNVSSHFGDKVRWEFSTGILYNEGNGVIIHELELVCLTGQVALGLEPVISTEYSVDGVTYSNPRTATVGVQGNRATRVTWMQQGYFPDWRNQKFYGSSDAHVSIIRLEAKLEGMSV